MKLSRKMTDRWIQGFALIVLLAIVAFFIKTVSDGGLSLLTPKEDYKNVYAYTESEFEE